jgi:hypothetical protein
MARPRFFTGRLVASTNTLRSIMGRRLEVEVRFTRSYKVISQNILSIKQESYPMVARR